MNLQDLGNIGEIVGALGVVLSVAYLAIQVRRNTQSLDASIDAMYVDFYLRWTETFSASSENSRLLRIGLNDPAELTDDETAHFSVCFVRFIMILEGLHSLHTRGVIASDRWRAAKTDIISFLGTPGGSLFWKGHRQGFSEDFRVAVDEVLASHEVEPFDLVSWRDR